MGNEIFCGLNNRHAPPPAPENGAHAQSDAPLKNEAVQEVQVEPLTEEALKRHQEYLKNQARLAKGGPIPKDDGIPTQHERLEAEKRRRRRKAKGKGDASPVSDPDSSHNETKVVSPTIPPLKLPVDKKGEHHHHKHKDKDKDKDKKNKEREKKLKDREMKIDNPVVASESRMSSTSIKRDPAALKLAALGVKLPYRHVTDLAGANGAENGRDPHMDMEASMSENVDESLSGSDAQRRRAKDITKPVSVQHQTHVTVDPKTGVFQNIPQEWHDALYKKFGRPVEELEQVELPYYRSKIPAILEQMKRYLSDHRMWDTQGIFRISPKQSDVDAAQKHLEDGTFDRCDAYVMSTLIKRFYHMLPSPILNSLPTKTLLKCETMEQAAALINKLKEPEKSLLQWLLDLCIKVDENRDKNQMGASNLAIVMAPNLYSIPPKMKNPQDVMAFTKQMAKFLEHAIQCRRAQREYEKDAHVSRTYQMVRQESDKDVQAAQERVQKLQAAKQKAYAEVEERKRAKRASLKEEVPDI